MNLTKSFHFVGSINLPNTSPSYPYEGEALEAYITKHESKYLTQILGYKMAKDLIETMLVETPPTSGIWYDLANGKEFTDSYGRLNKWVGFNTIGFNPIANYIYDAYVRENTTHITGVGNQKPNVANSVSVMPNVKLVEAWNEMVGLNNILYDFLTINKAVYPDYIGINSDNINLFTLDNVLGI